MIVVTKTGIFSQILIFFIVIFVCKPNQSISIALSPVKIEKEPDNLKHGCGLPKLPLPTFILVT